MEKKTYCKNSDVPCRKLDAVIDTDAFNEVDDQFAITYLLASRDKINLTAIYAAPFSGTKNVTDPKVGMEKSFEEIVNILTLTGCTDYIGNTFKGSFAYLKDEKTPVVSPAAEDLVRRAKKYSPENPLYVIAIGAITNVASAILMDPEIAENIVVVWLGGHAFHYRDTKEFNMRQDIAAVRAVFASKAPVVQLPCLGVVSQFAIPLEEMRYFLKGKNKICDYLCGIVEECFKDSENMCNSRIIWDVTAVAWLLNDNERFMMSRTVDCPLVDYNCEYGEVIDKKIRYVYFINRDALASDLFEKITDEGIFK